MLSNNEQRQALRALKDGGGYGMLCLIHRPGDVLFIVSPVPKLRGYEIVCATDNRLYDIWKNDQLNKSDQTRDQVRNWIRRKTPNWLYDGSTPTEKQKEMVCSWLTDFSQRYPDTMALG